MRESFYARGTASAATSLQRLTGYSIRETAAGPAAATVTLCKTDAVGDVVMNLELAANGSETIAFPSPINFGDVIYVNVVSGTVDWVVYGY